MMSISTGIDAVSLTEPSIETDAVEGDVVEILTTPKEIMPPSLPDNAALRSIPPLTIISITARLAGGSSQEADLEDTSPKMSDMELVTALATWTNKGRTLETPHKPTDTQKLLSLPPIYYSTPRSSVHQGITKVSGGEDEDQDQSSWGRVPQVKLRRQGWG